MGDEAETGRSMEPPYQGCHVNYKNLHVTPISFHSLSGYNLHMIIKIFATSFEGKFTLLLVNEEIVDCVPRATSLPCRSRYARRFVSKLVEKVALRASA